MFNLESNPGPLSIRYLSQPTLKDVDGKVLSLEQAGGFAGYVFGLIQLVEKIKQYKKHTSIGLNIGGTMKFLNERMAIGLAVGELLF